MRQRIILFRVACVCTLFMVVRPVSAQGLVFPGVGPVNQSMGGASVAAPLDPIGALYWNPGTLSGLPQSQVDFGAQMLYLRTRVSSQIAPNAFGPGLPATPLVGGTRSSGGVVPIPNFGLAYRPEDSLVTYGLGVFVIGGFGVDYEADPTNPILSPPPPNGFGLGSVYSDLALLQLAPAVSLQLTERLSFGIGPTITMARLQVTPAPFAIPDDANGNGFATFPPGVQNRYTWGAGFHAGVYYETWRGINLGASFRSPQWLETFRFRSTDEIGRPRTLKAGLDYPMIVSVGASYIGIERLLVALDLRYVGYSETRGFNTPTFTPTGSFRGLGWDSVFALALGAQYQLTERITTRMGYTFNENPIDDGVSAANIASPAIYQHILWLGASLKISETFSLNVAYYHAFDNSVEGPFLGAAGPVPGTLIRNDATIDSLAFGVTVRF